MPYLTRPSLPPVAFLLTLFTLGLTGPLFASYTAKADFSSCPRKYIANTSGQSGPFASLSACEAEIRRVKSESPMACARYWCVDNGNSSSSSSSSGSGSSLEQTSANAIAQGLVHGNAQALGAGLVGLSVASMLSGSSQPSPAELQRRREAELAAQEAYRAAEAVRLAKFENEKRETMSELKGDDAALVESDNQDTMGLKGEDEFIFKDDEEFKDAPASRPKTAPVSPRLKKMENPLQRKPRAGDAVGILSEFDSWEDAKTCKGFSSPGNTGGKYICCPGDFPYYCLGKCYSSDAFNDLRVPCNSIPLPTRQNAD